VFVSFNVTGDVPDEVIRYAEGKDAIRAEVRSWEQPR
jgi:hypothetical protein